MLRRDGALLRQHRPTLANGLGQIPEGFCDVRPGEKAGHAAEAIHLGKGVLERDIENIVPDPNAEVIMYCGGGYRSVLTADMAQKMGYKNVSSLIGGYKGLVAANWPMKREG